MGPVRPYPATVETTAVVDHQTSVAFWGNRYSVPPGFGGVAMGPAPPAGTGSLEVVSPSGALVLTHTLAPAGSGDDGAHPRAPRGAREGRVGPVHQRTSL